MKKILLAGVLTLGVTGAGADVIVDPHLSGTGDNVVFDSFNGTNLAIGSFNGQHTGLVNFTDLSGNPAFTGSANGNDIKIANTSDLQIQVFDATDKTVLTTFTQVFSLKGTGDVKAFVQATDGLFTFDLGTINPNAQSGFTLSAINGEVMSRLTLVDFGGDVTDYEHYRIDVAGPLVVPAPAVGAGLPGALGSLGLFWLGRYRRRVKRTSGLPTSVERHSRARGPAVEASAVLR